jgi:hypothetical protein
MQLVKADAHSIISKKNDSSDCRVSIVIVETLCLNFVHKVSSFGEIFHFQLPSEIIARRIRFELNLPLTLHEFINMLIAFIVAETASAFVNLFKLISDLSDFFGPSLSA